MVFNFQDNPRAGISGDESLLILPTKTWKALSKCLEINHSLFGSWICKKNDWTYVMFLREAAGLDLNEINATLDRVGVLLQ